MGGRGNSARFRGYRCSRRSTRYLQLPLVVGVGTALLFGALVGCRSGTGGADSSSVGSRDVTIGSLATAPDVAPDAASTSTQTAALSPYPLKVSSDGRHLVDQQGVPQFFAADTAWNLFTRLTDAQAAQYLDARKAQGFNTVLTSVVDVSAGGIGGPNRDGQAPFLNDDIGTPNAAYFDHVDAVLQMASDRGMQVVIVPAWLRLTANQGSYTTANVTAYGKWLGARYASAPNIIWMLGGDSGGPTEGTCPKQAETDALARAIKSTDSQHLMTYHPGVSLSSAECYGDSSWLDINANYWNFDVGNVSSAATYMARDYALTPARPTIMMETGYQGPFPTDTNPGALTALTSRIQSYDMVLSGAFGFTYGAQSTYAMVIGDPNSTRTWQETLRIPGGFQQGYITKLFTALDWWKLVPDLNHSTVTSGTGKSGEQDYVTAARAADGSFTVAYLPTTRAIGIDLSRFSGPVTARWFDPTTGTFTAAGTDLAAAGTRSFTPPSSNGSGEGDWVLLLQADVKP